MASPIVGRDPNFVPTIENQTAVAETLHRGRIAFAIGSVVLAGAAVATPELGGANAYGVILGSLAGLAGINSLLAFVQSRRAQRFVNQHA